jgi:hypothetical protein
MTTMRATGKKRPIRNIFCRLGLNAIRKGVVHAFAQHDAQVSVRPGKTWGRVRPFGFKGHCPYSLRHSSGVILLAHRLPATSLHWSSDDGKTWNGPVKIDTVGGAYPSLVELPDGLVYCVYYRGRAGIEYSRGKTAGGRQRGEGRWKAGLKGCRNASHTTFSQRHMPVQQALVMTVFVVRTYNWNAGHSLMTVHPTS